MRTKDGQKLHDDFVALVQSFLKRKGFTRVLADLPSQIKPPVLNGNIPDIYAVKIKQLLPGLPVINEVLIVEVETEDSQSTTSTLFQHIALRKWALNYRAAFETIIAR